MGLWRDLPREEQSRNNRPASGSEPEWEEEDDDLRWRPWSDHCLLSLIHCSLIISWYQSSSGSNWEWLLMTLVTRSHVIPWQNWHSVWCSENANKIILLRNKPGNLSQSHFGFLVDKWYVTLKQFVFKFRLFIERDDYKSMITRKVPIIEINTINMKNRIVLLCITVR